MALLTLGGGHSLRVAMVGALPAPQRLAVGLCATVALAQPAWDLRCMAKQVGPNPSPDPGRNRYRNPNPIRWRSLGRGWQFPSEVLIKSSKAVRLSLSRPATIAYPRMYRISHSQEVELTLSADGAV